MRSGSRTERALREVRAILAAYGIDDPFIDQLISWHDSEPERFRQEVVSNELWGGAGSLSDLYLPEIASNQARAREDDRRLRHALLELAIALQAEGITDERIQRRAATFQQWADEGF